MTKEEAKKIFSDIIAQLRLTEEERVKLKEALEVLCHEKNS